LYFTAENAKHAEKLFYYLKRAYMGAGKIHKNDRACVISDLGVH
jgi:hypothetical protein